MPWRPSTFPTRKCTSRTSSRASRSVATRCWRSGPSACCVDSAPMATNWRSAAWSPRSPLVAEPDRRAARLAALGAALEAAQLDALLLTSLANIRYLTGFSGSSAIVVATPREVALITDFRYATQVKDEVGDFAHVSIEPQSLWAGLWRVLPQLGGLEVIGFESAHLLHRDFERLLSGGSRWMWRPTADMVETLRERKDVDEVRRI